MKLLVFLVSVALSVTVLASQPDEAQQKINQRVAKLTADINTPASATIAAELPEKINCAGREILTLNTQTPTYVDSLFGNSNETYTVDGSLATDKKGRKIYISFNDGDQYDALLLTKADLKKLKSGVKKVISAYSIGGFEHGGDFYNLRLITCTLSN